MSLAELSLSYTLRASHRSIHDVNRPIIEKTVYETMFAGEGDLVDVCAAPRAVNRAVRALCDRGLHPARWAPYVYMGA